MPSFGKRDHGAGEYSRQSHLDGWSLYISLVNGTGVPGDLRRSYAFFQEALEFFAANEMVLEEAKARQGIALTAALLGRGEEACAAARRCIELLRPWVLPSGGGSVEQLEWTIKALRSLSDAAPDAVERLRSCRRGLNLLRRLPPSEKRTRWRALFHRAAGRAGPRREAHVRQAAALLEGLTVDRFLLVSKAKTYLELARALRESGKTSEAAAAERRAAEFEREAGGIDAAVDPDDHRVAGHSGDRSAH